MAKILPFIEKDILSSIELEIKNYLSSSFSNSKILNSKQIVLKDKRYEIDVLTGFDKELPIDYNIQILFNPLELKNSVKMIEIDQDISSIGKLEQAKLYIPENLKQHSDKILQITDIVTKTSYTYYEALMKDKLSDFFHKDLSESLYNKLREVCSREGKTKLEHLLWFTLINKDKGFYLVDYERLSKSLEKILAKKESHSFIPLNALTNFLTTVLPLQKMHSNDLFISGDKFLDMELRSSKYLKENPNFQYSEEIMYISSVITGYEISKAKNEKLVISFPKELKNNLLDIIPNVENEFLEILDKHRKKIGKFNWNLRKYSFKNVTQYMAELAGRFAGGYTDVTLK